MKFKKYLFLILFLRLIMGVSYAQYEKPDKPEKLERVSHVQSIKVTFLGLSYSYELPATRRSVINFEPMINGVIGSSFGSHFWLMAPLIRIEPRYYYNLLRRIKKGKKTIHNSANYLALAAEYQFGYSIGVNAEALQSFVIVAKWGLKRAIGDHFIFEFAIGPAAINSKGYPWIWMPALDLKLGYAF